MLRVSAEVNKHMEGVIQSAKFPAAQPPDPNQPSKIETEYWPCPPSLAAMGNIQHLCSGTFRHKQKPGPVEITLLPQEDTVSP